MNVISKYVCVLIGCFCIQSASSQTVDQIKQSPQYYWGEGVGKTTNLADKDALSMLIGSISVNIQSEFTQTTTQQGNQFTDYVNSLVTTYSTATIKNTEIMSWGEEPNVHVFRFVKKAEVGRIFAEREHKIKEFVEEARIAEAKYQIADALRYYYWGLMLLQSLPNAQSITIDVADKNQKLDVFIPRQINELLGNLNFAVSGKQAEEHLTLYTLDMTYKNRAVTNCDYAFFDGRNWSLVTAAKDGHGIAELVGDTSSHKTIRLKIEYAFENEWKIDNEVHDVLNKVDPIIFKKSYVDVSLTKSVTKIAEQANSEREHSRKARNNGTLQENTVEALPAKPLQPVDGTVYLSMLQRIETAIRTKTYESVSDCFTTEGYAMFTQLVHNGNAVIVAKPAYSFTKFEDGVLVRSLPMRFSFSNNRKVFVEDVVFNISPSEGKIRSLSFALSADACKDIMKYDQWGEYSRLAIINFIETYKTAYALKRLDYIESIFSDNALIIVGKMVKNQTGTDNVRLTYLPDKIKMTQYTKQQYIRQLNTVFKSNEYVNLKFTDMSVKKAGVGGEIYGIQLQQDYFSTTYGDKGYLFLMVDLNKTEEPTIHIRTWQPEKDPEFGVYDISNF
ncbi:hypothetical protein FACS1894201_07380 [Bacteroidia bacterium]|nr:hypothetical protein FACS1894201_07380 [Bacteroidia bacterium]